MNEVEYMQATFRQGWPSYSASIADSVDPGDLDSVYDLVLCLLPLIWADYQRLGDYPPYMPVRIVDLEGNEAFAAVAISFARLWATGKYIDGRTPSPCYVETRPASILSLLAA